MTRLLVLGDLNLDVHAAEPSETGTGQEVRAAVRVAPGGSAGTFARVAARLGAHVAFLGSVGTDPVGDLLEQDLRAGGVEPHLRRTAAPSGVVVALHRGHDRSMICSRGANDALGESDVDPALFADLDHLHVSGYAFLSAGQAAAARRAIALAQAARATVSANLPPANLVRSHGVERFRRDLDDISHLFLNRDEGRCLTGIDGDDVIVDALARRQVAGALTLGAEGALAWQGSQRDRHRASEALDVDPTGAGDAFAAAFIVSLLGGDNLSCANRRACDAARDHIAARSTPPRATVTPSEGMSRASAPQSEA
jgi:sugar/nucleoside kinase (ribokinase family)